MATVTIRDENRSLRDAAEISAFLARFGIWYRRFDELDPPGDHASDAEILAAYQNPIRRLKEEQGYETADVITIRPDLPKLDEMLAKFSREHWHDEDEVRFVVHGRGLFHLHPSNGPVFSVEVSQGDMINVPKGMHHWFHLCEERTIRAVRLFKEQAGWVPHYTDSNLDERYQPICFGPARPLSLASS